MKKLLFLLFITSFCIAQNANRKFISQSYKNNVLEIKTSEGYYLMKPFSEKIIETSFIPNGEKNNITSHAVIKSVENIKCKVVNNSKTLSLETSGIKVIIDKSPFKISYYYNNSLLLSEKNGYTKVNDSTHTIDFNIAPDEKLFGGGARALGMNRRGNRLQLYNRAHYGYETKAELMNFCIPLVLSSKIYAVHFDNAAIGYLDLDSQKNNTVTYETISGRKTYQVIVDDTWENLITNYTDLTGKQPLPPRWAFGNFSSRFGYHSQEEVENTIKKFQEDNIPVDAIILDLYWFGKTIKGTMGNLDWDKDNFPNPEKMIANLKAKGVNTILITEPFVLTTSSKWKEAVAQNILVTDAKNKPATWDFYFGNTSVVDIFKPEGAAWFWNVYKRLINQGVGGMWGDLGEPEVFPSEVKTAAGPADEVHNIYGHNWAKLIADGYAKDFPNQRPFILMRAGYSGSQRYGMIPWSGDVNRSWGGLASQMEIAMQMGMQGMGYMHSDLGGFAGDYFDNELYLRWLQYGVFQPIFRPHAQEEVASEVAKKDIATKAIAKKSVELRYQLLPYIYTLAFENSTSGKPLMRPLFFEEPTNEKALNEKESYLWGNDFLVKPITKAGVTATEVYFPKSSNWFDFYTDKSYKAGTTATVAVGTDYIPVFVRGGSFIPRIKTIQNTTAYSLNSFDLHFYYDETVAQSSGKLYNDDGATPDAFGKSAYELMTFTSNSSSKNIILKLAVEIGKKYLATDKTVTLTIHNCNAKSVTIDGKNVIFKNENQSVVVDVNWNKNTTPEIKIAL
ncbi:TIM-barrel domain-containing protein [Flavobacterium sp.]|uniref:glycoside hydrolase family 31 protein n=1 Tax=Flavobacterium sp. TaxID=239 RepID=UPI002BBD3040|nr:TIM-barrel domain-containing protein [Flavobacterium sp.]HQA73457.1 glycoside hydrolase family 31 protein [Flavobacterium sp.]